MKKHILFLLAFLSLGFSAKSQNCKIIANSKACVGEPVAFQVQIVSGTPISYAWDFAGLGTSSGSSPTFIFNTPGTLNITVTVNFSGGLSCNASFLLQVNEIPQTVFYVDSVNNVYCRNKSMICLDDVTQRSGSNAPLKQRIIVWGDGALGQNLDPENERHDCHHYADTGEYEITMEITDTNSCKTNYRRTIHIVPDLIAHFTYSVSNTCDSVRVCFDNTSVYDSTNPPHFRWYPGDGTVDSSTFKNYCKNFKGSGHFTPSLVLYNQYGCLDSNWADDEINVQIPNIILTKNKTVMCKNNRDLAVSATLATPAQYTWILEDSSSGTKVIKNTGGINSDVITIPGAGKWYVYVLVQIGGCLRKSQVDTVYVKGPEIAVTALNARQCHSNDTVHFCVEKNFYLSHPSVCKFSWDFGDSYAAQCTTDTRKNQNVGMNCNFSHDTGHVTHLYKGDTCFQAKLIVVDTVSGCSDESKVPIALGEPDAHGLKILAKQACWSIRRPVEYGISFNADSLKPYCGLSKILINTDSARNKNNWVDFSTVSPIYVYDSVADDSGWVTIGIIAKMGETNVYDGCVHVNPNDSATICTDTVWYHHALRLLPEPKPLFFLDKNQGCNPLHVKLRLSDSTQGHIRKITYFWGDTGVDSVLINPGDTIHSFGHTFLNQGFYFIRAVLENENYCTYSYQRRITIGFYKQVKYDTIACAKNAIQFIDSIEYWDALTGNWKDPNRAGKGLEQVWWHFGDGTSASGHAPFKVYKDTGTYQVAMVSVDSMGCYDSSIFGVSIVGVKAGVKSMPMEVVCNEIVTFFDSSRKVGTYPGDSIVKYWWDFGDKKIPSVLKNATHAYTSFGTFTITHVVENLKGCKDTTRLQIHMEGPVPRFAFLTDSIGCVPFTIKLDNLSDTSTIRDYLWDFNDINNSTVSTQSDSDVSFTYNSPGTYYLKLTGAKNVYSPSTGNVYYCKAVYPDIPTNPEKKVIVLPIPAVGFTMPDTVCPGEQFTLNDNSDPKYTIYVWHFSNDSVKTNTPSIKHSIDSAGDFTVIYTPYYIPGAQDRLCVDTAQKKIHVSAIKADFDIDSLLSEDPKFFFRNKSSSEAVSYVWNFGHSASSENSSFALHPFHNFDPDTGIFMVCLRAINSQGCEDTICKPVHISYFPHVHYYNVFTPGNSDSLNNVFDIDIKGESYYKLRVYNRWGALVFESDEDGNENDGKNWNGKKFNSGEECPAGTYYYIFEYRILQGGVQRVFGTCTLIRDK